MTRQTDFHFGWDVVSKEFILWKRGRKTEVARIPITEAPSLIVTMAYVIETQLSLNTED